jgi:bisphosphoglycerate-dependent phosphoglycerate mutase
MGKFIIARHNESEWNKLGKWTGLRDRHLTDLGFEKSNDMGVLIKDFNIDCAFASMQVRSIETLSCMLNVCNLFKVPTEHSAALNERDYGEYTGMNKWEMEETLGEEEFKKLRRSWDHPIPNGESLKMVYERTVPYFLEKILPRVKEGKNVLVVAHGNSLRTLIKYIENISDEAIADVEMPFGSIIIYDLDDSGHLIHKEVRQVESQVRGKNSKAQIVVTIGPKSDSSEIIRAIISRQIGVVVRLNFSWSDIETHGKRIKLVMEIGSELEKSIPIIIDLPGPRVKNVQGHAYDKQATSPITEEDEKFIRFGIEHGVEYFAQSFVGSNEDVVTLRKMIESFSGTQRIIAKIERKTALDSIDDIIKVADAIMIARGDLGSEIPLEQIPFEQERIIKKCKEAGKPVITATQMLLSMVESPTPERAEVSDVTSAILQGSDAVMLSDETTMGKYPVEAVAMMEKIIIESELHESSQFSLNPL